MIEDIDRNYRYNCIGKGVDYIITTTAPNRINKIFIYKSFHRTNYMRSKRKKIIKESVSESVKRLLDEARKEYMKGKKELADRYVRMTVSYIKKHKIRLPEEYRNSFCRKCYLIWIPGVTVKVFFDRKHNCLRIECMRCGFSKRL